MTPLYQAPSVTGAKASSSTGAALWQHLTTSFGYLNKEVRKFNCNSAALHAVEIRWSSDALMRDL